MKLKSLNKFIGFLILIFLFSPSLIIAEQEIDIWNKEKKQNNQNIQSTNNSLQKDIKPKASDTIKISDDIKITDGITNKQGNKNFWNI